MDFRRAGARLILAAILSSFWVASAYAAPIGGGDGGSPDPKVIDCLTRTITSFTATPSTISLGATAALSWSVRIPTDCQQVLGQNLSLNGAPVGLTGSQSAQPLSTTEFRLEMIAGRAVSTLGDITVTVQMPSVVHIKGNTPDWKALLVQALSTPHTTIYLASNVDMDLSGQQSLVINDGVSVIGGEPCGLAATQGGASSGTATQTGGSAIATTTATATFSLGATTPSVPAASLARVIISPIATNICGGRSPQQFGPRLFTTTRPNGLFVIPCDWGFVGNVRLDGFRIQGPHWGSEDGDANLERGIIVSSCNHVDIGNMELSGWSGSAVYVTDYPGLVVQAGPGAVKIH